MLTKFQSFEKLQAFVSTKFWVRLIFVSITGQVNHVIVVVVGRGIVVVVGRGEVNHICELNHGWWRRMLVPFWWRRMLVPFFLESLVPSVWSWIHCVEHPDIRFHLASFLCQLKDFGTIEVFECPFLKKKVNHASRVGSLSRPSQFLSHEMDDQGFDEVKGDLVSHGGDSL